MTCKDTQAELPQSDMHAYLLVAFCCLFFLPPGFKAEECLSAVLAARATLHTPAGGNLSLSCVVQHCGLTWTGEWMWMNVTDTKLRAVGRGSRTRVTSLSLSANQTRLFLDLWGVAESDQGSYTCRVTWDQGGVDQGRFTYVNVTADAPSQRKLLHRILVLGAASLCLPVVLLLARCLSSEVKPQPLPRTRSRPPAGPRAGPRPTPQPPPRRPAPQKRSGASSYKARPESQQKTEVVYADISQQALRQQPARRQPDQSTVYATPVFSS